MADSEKDYETREGVGIVGGGARTEEEARRLHHLATADPEPERDGTMTGPAHEAKYGLERAEDSAAKWRAAGVHPFENRALVPGDEGFVDPAAEAGVNTAESKTESVDPNTIVRGVK
jgi:hypothetical protein